MTYGTDSSWTEERTAELQRLVATGLYTNTQIAIRLGSGTTRNAVIGKLKRMGISKPKPFTSPEPTLARPTPVEPTPLVGGACGSIISRRVKARLKPLKLPAIEISANDKVHLRDIRDGQCRYIEGDERAMMMCGRPTVDALSSWCAGHFRLCYRPPSRA